MAAPCGPPAMTKSIARSLLKSVHGHARARGVQTQASFLGNVRERGISVVAPQSVRAFLRRRVPRPWSGRDRGRHRGRNPQKSAATQPFSRRIPTFSVTSANFPLAVVVKQAHAVRLRRPPDPVWPSLSKSPAAQPNPPPTPPRPAFSVTSSNLPSPRLCSRRLLPSPAPTRKRSGLPSPS